MPSEGSCGHRGSGPEGELRRKGTRNAVCPVGSPRSGEPAPRRERRSDGGKGRSDRGRDSKTAEIGQRHGAVGRGGAGRGDTRLALAWEKTASSGRASRQCVGGTGQVVSGEMQSAVITQQRRGADHTPSSGPGQADSTALLSGGRCPRGRHLQGSEASGTRGRAGDAGGAEGPVRQGEAGPGSTGEGVGVEGGPGWGGGPRAAGEGRRQQHGCPGRRRARRGLTSSRQDVGRCSLAGQARTIWPRCQPSPKRLLPHRSPEDGITWVEPEPNSTETVDPEVSPTHCGEQSARRKLAKRVPR